MHRVQAQKGFASLQIIITLFSAIVLGILAIRLCPVYYADFVVAKILQETANNPTTMMTITRDPEGMQKLLYTKFNINNVADIKVSQIQFVRDKDSIKLKLEYDVRVAMFANIDAMVHFNHDIQVGSS